MIIANQEHRELKCRKHDRNYSDALNSYSIILLFQAKHCSVRKEIISWRSFSRGRNHFAFFIPGVSTPGYKTFAPDGAYQLFRDFKRGASGANVFDYSKFSFLTEFNGTTVHHHFLGFRPERQINIGCCIGRNSKVHIE